MALSVYAWFKAGWVTFVAMKDAFDQCLYRPQVDVAREVLPARDLLIDLEKVALHPALNKELKVVSDLNVGIVEALKLKQPVLVALFVARRQGEATASEKVGAIHTAHAQLKELKAIGGKSGFAELVNWANLPPDHGSIWGAPAPPGPAHSPPPRQRRFRRVEGSSGAGDFGSAYMGGACGGGGGHASGGPGHNGPTNGRSHRVRGGRGGRRGRGGGSGRSSAICRKCTLAGSTSTNHPHTICPLKQCFKCGKLGHVRQFFPN